MGFMTNNVDAFLKMGAASATDPDDLPAVGSDTLTEVPLTQVITPAPREKSVGSFNVLNDSDPRSLGGKKSAQTVTGTIVIDRDRPLHLQMISDANADGAVYRNWQTVDPDGWTRTFKGFISALNDSPYDATGDAEESTMDYTISVTGNIDEEMVTP